MTIVLRKSTFGHAVTKRPACFSSYEVHIDGGGADVLGCDVAASEGVDDPTVGAEETLRLVHSGVTDDDRFAPAEIESCGGRLVGHPFGEAQNILECLGFGLIRKKASPAEGGTESRGVDGDNRLESGYLVIPIDDLLMASDGHLIKHWQGRFLLLNGVGCTPLSILLWGRPQDPQGRFTSVRVPAWVCDQDGIPQGVFTGHRDFR